MVILMILIEEYDVVELVSSVDVVTKTFTESVCNINNTKIEECYKLAITFEQLLSVE